MPCGQNGPPLPHTQSGAQDTLQTSACQLRSPVSILAHSDTLPLPSVILCQAICPQLPPPAEGTNRPLPKGIVLSLVCLQILGIIDSDFRQAREGEQRGQECQGAGWTPLSFRRPSPNACP